MEVRNPRLLEMRDNLNLDVGAFGQGRDLYGRPSGKIHRKVLRVDFIHSGEVRQISQKDGALDDVGKGKFLIIQDSFHVLQYAIGLGFDVSADEVAGGRI